jgi:Holliday junction resolvase RusA-like endonuclease
MHIHSLKKINEGYIFLCAEFFFPNNRRKDLDNVTKLFLDVFKKADFIEDDSQISTLLTFKEVNKAKPGILIHSLAYSPTRSARIEWLQLMLQKLEKK